MSTSCSPGFLSISCAFSFISANALWPSSATCSGDPSTFRATNDRRSRAAVSSGTRGASVRLRLGSTAGAVCTLCCGAAAEIRGLYPSGAIGAAPALIFAAVGIRLATWKERDPTLLEAEHRRRGAAASARKRTRSFMLWCVAQLPASVWCASLPFSPVRSSSGLTVSKASAGPFPHRSSVNSRSKPLIKPAYFRRF